MERWNKQIIACLLIAVILSFAVFSDCLVYETNAMIRTSFEASASDSKEEDTGIMTSIIEKEKVMFNKDRTTTFLNVDDSEMKALDVSSDRKVISKDNKSFFGVMDFKETALHKEVILHKIKNDVFFAENEWKDPKEIQAGAAATEPVPVVAEPVLPSEWDNKVMARVEEEVNIREQANADSPLVGKLKKGASGEILEQNGEWTKISSGNVTGYVSNEFLAFGMEAKELAEHHGVRVATVQADTLRVRKEPGEESDIVSLAAQGNILTVNSEENGWLSVKLSSGENGYVKSEYVTTELKLETAISVEEEQAAIRAAEQAAAEKAKAQEEQAAKKKAAVEAKSRNAIQAEADEETLLAGLVQLEAGGESYEGKLAVANVVINRVNSSRYPKSIRMVIYQKGQFPGATNGKLARILEKGVKSDCLKAARDAIAGNNNIGNHMYFNSVGTLNTNNLGDYTIIGNQCFY